MKRYFIPVIIILLAVGIGSCKKDPPAILELSVNEVLIANIDGTSKVQVTANGKWTASVASTWCTISPSSGDGNGEITITTVNNFTGSDRIVNMVVTSRELKKSLRISQSYSRLDVSALELLFPKEAGSKTVFVDANTSWSVEIPSGIDWITVSPMSGTASGNVTVSLLQNTGTHRSADIFFKFGEDQKSLKINQERSINQDPAVPVIKSPVDNLTDANRLPTFRWSASKDPEGDPLTYKLEYTKNQADWSDVITLTDTVYNLSYYLDENSTYYWRITAQDAYGGKGVSDVYTFTTGVKKSYFDGQYKVAQTNTKGLRPSEILFIGDGYISEDFEEGGIFDRDIDNGIEYFFEIEPYKSYREYFTIYKQAGYSIDRGVKQTDKSVMKYTKFGVDFLGGSSLSADTDEVFKYAKMIPGVDDQKLKEMLIILVVNQDRYAGTCWIWTDGKAIAICPVSTSNTAGQHFRNLIYHEAGGHGYGRLADEYITSANAGKTINEEYKSKYNTFKNAGFYPNVDLTGDPANVKWKHFINLPGYNRVGTVEGGFYFPLGVWRPEQSSCMQYNEAYYNAPSREKMVQRILSIAQEPYSLDIFMQKDIQKAPSQSVLLQTKSINPFTFVPLAPPVMMK